MHFIQRRPLNCPTVLKLYVYLPHRRTRAFVHTARLRFPTVFRGFTYGRKEKFRRAQTYDWRKETSHGGRKVLNIVYSTSNERFTGTIYLHINVSSRRNPWDRFSKFVATAERYEKHFRNYFSSRKLSRKCLRLRRNLFLIINILMRRQKLMYARPQIYTRIQDRFQYSISHRRFFIYLFRRSGNIWIKLFRSRSRYSNESIAAYFSFLKLISPFLSLSHSSISLYSSPRHFSLPCREIPNFSRVSVRSRILKK
ncbi:hypothetical protein PUN28_000200 [Cardiocondyla obscurior]|uniref:Ribosomal protein S3 n=1 Tax=Cardiocondyla obscurior TaxID=286306 RepID=A0AAW2GYB4_9HYME